MTAPTKAVTGKAATGLRLLLDPIACDGHGICAGLLPELISLDEWGYPMLSSGTTGDVPESLTKAAKRAVNACPALALHLRRAAD